MSQEEIEKLTDVIEELSDRLRELEDIEELKCLQTNVNYWLCNRQWDDIVNSFASGAIVNYRGEERTGREQIEDFFKNVLARQVTPDTGYIIGQPILVVQVDKASGYWMQHQVFSNPVRWVQGRQECDYIKDYGVWKIKYLRFVSPWPEA